MTRTILAALKKERANPAGELQGRQALFVVNLEPRRMAGEVSEGMLFDLGYEDGIVPVLAVPERPVPDGTRARLRVKECRLFETRPWRATQRAAWDALIKQEDGR